MRISKQSMPCSRTTSLFSWRPSGGSTCTGLPPRQGRGHGQKLISHTDRRSDDRAMTKKTLVTSRPEVGLKKKSLRKLRTVSPQTALSLAWLPSSCKTNVWAELCQAPQLSILPDTREKRLVPVEFAIHALHHLFGDKVFQRVFPQQRNTL